MMLQEELEKPKDITITRTKSPERKRKKPRNWNEIVGNEALDDEIPALIQTTKFIIRAHEMKFAKFIGDGVNDKQAAAAAISPEMAEMKALQMRKTFPPDRGMDNYLQNGVRLIVAAAGDGLGSTTIDDVRHVRATVEKIINLNTNNVPDDQESISEVSVVRLHQQAANEYWRDLLLKEEQRAKALNSPEFKSLQNGDNEENDADIPRFDEIDCLPENEEEAVMQQVAALDRLDELVEEKTYQNKPPIRFGHASSRSSSVARVLGGRFNSTVLDSSQLKAIFNPTGGSISQNKQTFQGYNKSDVVTLMLLDRAGFIKKGVTGTNKNEAMKRVKMLQNTFKEAERIHKKLKALD